MCTATYSKSPCNPAPKLECRIKAETKKKAPKAPTNLMHPRCLPPKSYGEEKPVDKGNTANKAIIMLRLFPRSR